MNNDPDNIARLRTSYQALTEVLSKAGAAPGPNGSADEEPAAEADESAVEGEFREVPN